jgi:2-polyprenyl-3-methyl-5-hydroxy-6-metoxy-1,4-benzoquinol methylase
VKKRLSVHEAVLRLRADPSQTDVVRDAYLGADVREACERFLASGEFRDLRARLTRWLPGARVLDVGAGTGIASHAFARAGAARVVALEPDPSDVVGNGAARRAAGGFAIDLVGAHGEGLPFRAGAFDVVYARQVLHHTQDLPAVLRECARVLRPGGVLAACREHVVDDARQLARFRAAHPIHRLAANENAYPLDAYLSAVRGAGFRDIEVLGQLDSLINAYPAAADEAELRDYARAVLRKRFGAVGTLAAMVPGVQALVRRMVNTMPGRLYSFFAVKP